MEHSKIGSNSWDHQLYFLWAQLFLSWDNTYSWLLYIIIQPSPHRMPVALFWDLFRGHHLTSWQWMAGPKNYYPHEQLGVSEMLQPDSLIFHWSRLEHLLCDNSVPSTIVELHHNCRWPSLSRIFEFEELGNYKYCSCQAVQWVSAPSKLCSFIYVFLFKSSKDCIWT